MANFLLALDPDQERRGRCVRDWLAGVSWRREMATGEAALPGGGTLAWCAGPRAPLDVWRGPDGSVGFVAGDAIDGPRGRRSAREVAEALRDVPDGFTGFDGYHVAVAADPTGRAAACADPLGLFPVYHGPCGEAYLVSSTPAAFLCHPSYDPRLDEEGLAALLAVHGTLAGRTLLRDVRRLPPAHVLVRDAGGRLREQRVFGLPAGESLAHLPVAEQDDVLHEAIGRAVRRHVPGDGPVGLLLTGGRDSRMLAGYLGRAGVPIRARTFGEPRDLEARVAGRVSGRAGFAHDVRPLGEDAFTRGIDLQVRLDHLASGAAHVYWWGSAGLADDLPERTVTGHLFDVVVGGLFRAYREAVGESDAFEDILPAEERAGVGPDVLPRLLRTRRAAEALAWVRSTLEEAYLAEPPRQRLWRWMTALSNRTQLGGLPWRLSFGSWPVVPLLDRELLTTVASLDGPSFAERRGQDRITVRRFPELARLPHLHGNAHVAPPLLSSPLQRLHGRLRDRLRPDPTRRRRRDPRFIWRMSDFDHPGWKAVRRLAEPHRSRLHALLDPGVLDEYLPAPGRPLPRHTFDGGKGRKLLVALALWLDHTGL